MTWKIDKIHVPNHQKRLLGYRLNPHEVTGKSWIDQWENSPPSIFLGGNGKIHRHFPS
jgi:hypothetical protein